MLKDKIKKKISRKKDIKTTRVNLLNSQPGSWDQNNLIESKLK
jgi:hypothetical protein